MFVVTADQRNSRRGPDEVPAMLAELAALTDPARLGRADPHRLPFERTAGDEVQGLLSEPVAVVDVVVTLLRGGWWVGVGVGAVDEPAPDSARAGRGPAYVAARQAVDSAKGAAAGICVVGKAGTDEAEQAEAAAWLLATLLARRTSQGWQVVDLVAAGAKGIDAARKLGISPQAVSSRLRVAGWTEELRGRELLSWLLARADQPVG